MCSITPSRSPTFDGATSELRFDSTVTLEHFETALPDYPLEEYARTYPFRYSTMTNCPTSLARWLHHYPSDDVAPLGEAVSGSVGDAPEP